MFSSDYPKDLDVPVLMCLHHLIPVFAGEPEAARTPV
jgi:hypothetical protein